MMKTKPRRVLTKICLISPKNIIIYSDNTTTFSFLDELRSFQANFHLKKKKKKLFLITSTEILLHWQILSDYSEVLCVLFEV